jgi:hypothetical protein
VAPVNYRGMLLQRVQPLRVDTHELRARWRDSEDEGPLKLQELKEFLAWLPEAGA